MAPPRKSQKAKLRQTAPEPLENSQSSSSSAQLDLSQLHKSVTSVLAFNEVVKAYKDGTSEIKDLLERETDLIYECKVCRNMFRSLVNFLSHKRVYCRQKFHSMNHFHFENEKFQDLEVSSVLANEENCATMENLQPNKKDLSSICERLMRKQLNTQQVDKRSSEDVTIELTSVETTQKAVYQSVINGRVKTSNMNIQVKEVEKILVANQHSTIGPDGKAVKQPPVDSAVHQCGVCSSCFDTAETLKVHQQKLHTPSTLIYQCPDRKNGCSIAYTRPNLIIGHLINDHQIHRQKVRKMREDVNKSAIRVDQIKMVVKKQEPTETPTENWDLNVDGLIDTSSKPANTCPRCLRKFSRDSTYISHMSSCGASVTIRRNAKNAQKVEIKPIVAELPPPKIKRNIPDIAERMATKRKLRSSTNARMVEIQDENDKENKNLKIKEELEPPVKKRRYTKKAKVVKESAGVKSPTKRLRPKTK